MKIQFYKYHGTGNDFVLIDNRKEKVLLSQAQINHICDRHFGIGADGLMTINPSVAYDFEMKYYNADGKEGSMCGNGGRCISLFARHSGMIKENGKFIAIDGEHEFEIISSNEYSGIVAIKLGDVNGFTQHQNEFFLDTGSPHFVKFVKNISSIDPFAEGKKIRWEERFKPNGTNVNFVELLHEKLVVRTFERGVENITLSCGTGVVASALAAFKFYGLDKASFEIVTYGGDLKVNFQNNNNGFNNIWLEGPAQKSFEGEIEI
jgi:diaminopimelate epimerase